MMLPVTGKKVLVLGLARSGLAVARLLHEEGALVTGSDVKPEQDLDPGVRDLRGAGVRIEAGGHSEESLQEIDFIVVSPGIPEDVPILNKAKEMGIPMYSELEVAWWWARAPVVAVTGSNGKTTTTTLIGKIFRRAGRATRVAGNIGFPLAGSVREVPPDGVLAVEVSSFQLERIETFQPRVGVILNITPDHLDRQGSMEAYVCAKASLLMNQQSADVAVLNLDDPRTAALREKAPGRVVGYSMRGESRGGVFVRNGWIVSQVTGDEEKILAADKVGIPGPHNLSNCLAAVAAVQVMGVDSGVCAEELVKFKGLEHRLELVRVLDGVQYINDSKATNVDAVEQALLTFSGSIVLIAGGRDKDADFERLRPIIEQRVRLLLLLGEARQKMLAAWGNLVTAVEVEDLREAVLVAQRNARPGECVLLSPACASFDMFRDFEDRGRVFKEIVKELPEGHTEKSASA